MERERRGNWVYYRTVLQARSRLRDAFGGEPVQDVTGRRRASATAPLIAAAHRAGAPMRLVVIGGSDAGISAALRRERCPKDVEATVVVADDYPNFSICGLPFYVSGEMPEWRQLAHRTLAELEQTGMQAAPEPHGDWPRSRSTRGVCGEPRGSGAVPWVTTRLVIATGAGPIRPPMPGLDLPNVHVLHTMDNSFRRARPGGVWTGT